MRIWAWLTSLFGLAILGLTYVDGAQLGVWADEHPTVSASLPADGGQFAVAAIGLVLVVGGAIAGILGRRRGHGEP